MHPFKILEIVIDEKYVPNYQRLNFFNDFYCNTENTSEFNLSSDHLNMGIAISVNTFTSKPKVKLQFKFLSFRVM